MDSNRNVNLTKERVGKASWARSFGLRLRRTTFKKSSQPAPWMLRFFEGCPPCLAPKSRRRSGFTNALLSNSLREFVAAANLTRVLTSIQKFIPRILRVCILRVCILRVCILRVCILRVRILRVCILRVRILRVCILRVRILYVMGVSFAVLGFVAATASSGSGYTDAEFGSIQTSNEAKVEELRRQEINQLRIALGRRIATNRRADLYLRLAELHLEGYRASFLLEGRVHEKRLAEGKQDRVIDRGRSIPHLEQGIKACNEILRLGIPYEKLDQVYYFLGFNYGELGNRKESLKNFEFLTHKYPDSLFVGEAYRELGDTAFEGGQFRKAQGYYESATKKKTGDSLPRVLHRLAWTHYRLRAYDRAVLTMKDAISRASQSGEKFLSLREEALRDMAVFMTESGKVDEAIAYFQSVVGDKSFYPKVLEKLGRQYERNVEPVKATHVYESLLKTDPGDEVEFRVRAKLVDLDLRQGQHKSALGRFRGAKIMTRGEQDTQTAAQNLRAMIRRTATENHEAYRKDGNKVSLAVAEEFYEAYLGQFLSIEDLRKEAPEIEMYLADVKRELGKAKEASEIYRKVVDSGDKRYAKEAGALWTASLADAIKKAGSSPAGTKSDENKEPSALEMEFVTASDALRDALGDMPEGRESALKAAQLLAGYKSTQNEAIDRIQKLIARWPRSQQALTAARLWVQLLADRLAPIPIVNIEKSDEAEDLRDVIDEIRKNTQLLGTDQELGGGKLKQLLADQDSRFRVGHIAAREHERDFEAAGKGYEAFAAEVSQHDLAEKAYSNAVTAFIKAGNYEAVARVLKTWLGRYPKSLRPIEATRSAATAALIGRQFTRSAELFEKLGNTGRDPDSLLMAARLFEGDGNGAKARSLWEQFLKSYGSSPARWGIALLLAQSYESAQKDSEAVKAYRYCITGPGAAAAECGARLADLYLRSQDITQAKDLFKKVSLQADKNKTISPFVGYARFRLAELLEKEANHEPLRLPEAQLKKGLGQRLEFFEKLSRAYLSVVEAGGPWAVAALDRMANWAMNFAEEVNRLDGPGAEGGVSPQFRASLSGVSTPLKKKAFETWRLAYEKAVTGAVLSPALPSIADRMADEQIKVPFRAQGFYGKYQLAWPGGAVDYEKTREKLQKNAKDTSSWIEYGNLLYADGKSMLALLAFERALSLEPKNAFALNNRGIVALDGAGGENWLRAYEASEFFSQAIKQDEFLVVAKFNKAALLNYYRLFQPAKALWQQVVAKLPSADGFDGLAVSMQGLGDLAGAEASFAKAAKVGADVDGFAAVFHSSARAFAKGTDGAARCLTILEELQEDTLKGFERDAVVRLKGTCTLWKNTK